MTEDRMQSYTGLYGLPSLFIGRKCSVRLYEISMYLKPLINAQNFHVVDTIEPMVRGKG